jgi:hypothetical protein
MTIATVTAGTLITPAWGNSVVDAINSFGVKGYGTVSTIQGPISTAGAALTGLSVTFTAEAGRLYQISATTAPAVIATATEAVLLINANGTTIAASAAVLRSGGNFTGLPVTTHHAPGAISVTYSLTMSANAGTIQNVATGTVRSTITVVDIGPV